MQDTPTTTGEPTLAPFKFDTSEYQVEVTVSGKKDKKVEAKLRKPTISEEHAREEASRHEFKEVSASEDEVRISEELANAALFDATVLSVKGYRLTGEPKEASQDFRPATPELLALIPSTHKSAFVRGARNFTCRLVEDDEEDVVLGGDQTLNVELIFGNEASPAHRIEFFIPVPSESERIKFIDSATQLRQSRKEKSSRIVTNVKATIEFLQTLMSRTGADVKGATVQGNEFAKLAPLSKKVFIDSIDPHIACRAVVAAMQKYNARLSD